MWTDWAKLKETLATLQTAEDEEESDGKSSTVAKRKRESDASPMEFHRMILAGSKIWDSLINLRKIIELLVQGKDEVSGSQMVQHL